jgi:hypothetical protein
MMATGEERRMVEKRKKNNISIRSIKRVGVVVGVRVRSRVGVLLSCDLMILCLS